MAGARIADSLTEYNNIKKGFFTQGLTNWATTARPAIPAGFTIEIGGSVYQFASEDVIDLGALSGAQWLYVVITVDSADVVSAEFSATPPTSFNTALNGWYTGADRYLPYVFYWDGAASYLKYKILNIEGTAFVLVDGDGRFVSLKASSIETDGTALRTKVIEIGDWNMVATQGLSVAHGLTLAKIRSISVTIRNDSDNGHYPFPVETISFVYSLVADATNIGMFRETGNFFDNVDFNSTSYNRGWITIVYEA